MTAKFHPKAFEPFDEEERELMEAEERGEFKPVSKEEFERLSKLLKEAAETSIASRKMISIKVPEADLRLLKQEAEKKGLRYQSLINSILHQYATGHLKSV